MGTGRRAGWQLAAVAWAVPWTVALAACSDTASEAAGAGAGSSGLTDVVAKFDSAASSDAAKPDAGADAAQLDSTDPADALLPDLGVADSGDAAAQPDSQEPDGGTDSSGDTIDPGLFGAPCVEGVDCDSGFCVEGSSGPVCGKLCQGACPAGWTCASLQSPSSDIVNVCVPSFARLCDPCQGAGDCNAPGLMGGVCLASGKSGNDGSFCATACIAGKPDSCPSGYSCKAGGGGNVCLPTSGQCSCSVAASAKELATVCSVQSDFGTCVGQRSCKGGGLSDCSVGPAAAETCNNLDDDCNGKTDDVAASACESKNEFGTCQGKVSGCDSSGPLCSAAKAAPETCNGKDDDCDGQTDEGLCEDGNPCTTGSCNSDGSCQQTPAVNTPCDDANLCTQVDTCQAGACQGAQPKVCDDGNPCTADACDPQGGCVGPAVKPGTACSDDGNPCSLDQCVDKACEHLDAAPGTACSDDGNPCTLDQCQGKACQHPDAPAGSACQDDGNPCSDDQCSGGACQHPPAKLGTACPDDGDSCTADLCDGAGGCSHGIGAGLCKIAGKCALAGAVNPANPCQVCDPKTSTTAWVTKDGLVCSDGNPCTTGDACSGGQCKGAQKSCSSLDSACSTGLCSPVTGACAAVPKAAGSTCSDGNACTQLDGCDGAGGCAGKAVDCSALTSGCATGVCSAGQCLAQSKPNGITCSDGDACTTADICTSGKCAGKILDCSSKADQCNDGACVNGTCQAKPKANGLLCSDSSTCTANDNCVSGKCTGTSTADAYEPNSSTAPASLPNKTDCDAAGSAVVTISPAGESDWYSYQADDKTGCTIKPSARIDSMAADYDLCVYFQCNGAKFGDDNLSCTDGSEVSGGPNGSHGCCSKNAGTASDFAKVSPSCSFGGLGSESGKVWVNVTPKAAAICGSYTLTWSAKN